MVEIKPGAELDRAVAEAVEPWCSVGMCASSGCIDIPASEIGDTAESDPDVLAVWKWDGERNWRKLPKFSTDLNAAFAAAEKAGLFDDPDVMVARDEVNQWRVVRHLGLRDWDTMAIQATPALAICAAILKLKESSDG